MAKQPAKMPERLFDDEKRPIVAMIEYSGGLYVATTCDIYLLSGRNKDRLKKLRLVIDDG
jgi:hypothetical protein